MKCSQVQFGFVLCVNGVSFLTKVEKINFEFQKHKILRVLEGSASLSGRFSVAAVNPTRILDGHGRPRRHPSHPRGRECRRYHDHRGCPSETCHDVWIMERVEIVM